MATLGCKDITDATEAFNRGEERGFEFFYNTLYGQLVYYARSILRDEDEAKDKVEDSFIKIWERRQTFFHHKVIKSWLYVTIRNACLNHLVQEERHNEAHKEIEHLSTDREESNLERIVKAETYGEIYNHLKILPRECRKVFILMYVHGYELAQVSQLLGLSISTVKNQKARGLELIRKNIGYTKEQYLANCAKLITRLRNSTLDDCSIRKLYGVTRGSLKYIKAGSQARRYH